MKKYLALLLSIFLVLSLAACGNTAEESVPLETTSNAESAVSESNTPERDVNLRNDNSSANITSIVTMEGNAENMTETRVILTIEDVVIPATLNNTVTAQAFIERLPFTVTASKAGYDFCGTVEELACDDSERQAGWKNGDIGYSNGWFALFHSGEEQSASYTSEMIIGHIDDEYLETIRGLSGRIEITIALAEARTLVSPPRISTHERTPAKMQKLELLAEDAKFIIILNDSEAARDFLTLLPLTLMFEDYAGVEKISYLPRKLSLEGTPSGFDPSVGDLTFYAPLGNLGIFYKEYGYANGIVSLGQIESGIEKFAKINGNFTAEITKIE